MFCNTFRVLRLSLSHRSSCSVCAGLQSRLSVVECFALPILLILVGKNMRSHARLRIFFAGLIHLYSLSVALGMGDVIMDGVYTHKPAAADPESS